MHVSFKIFTSFYWSIIKQQSLWKVKKTKKYTWFLLLWQNMRWYRNGRQLDHVWYVTLILVPVKEKSSPSPPHIHVGTLAVSWRTAAHPHSLFFPSPLRKRVGQKGAEVAIREMSETLPTEPTHDQASVLCSVLSPWASHLLQHIHMFYLMNLFLIRAAGCWLVV